MEIAGLHHDGIVTPEEIGVVMLDASELIERRLFGEGRGNLDASSMGRLSGRRDAARFRLRRGAGRKRALLHRRSGKGLLCGEHQAENNGRTFFMPSIMQRVDQAIKLGLGSR